jgi:hypothetical protein
MHVPPTLASALASKLDRVFYSFQIVFLVLIPVLSFGEDSSGSTVARSAADVSCSHVPKILPKRPP